MQYAPVVGRVLFSAIFLMFGMAHFTDPNMVNMVPSFLPAKSAVVILTGIMIIVAGLSVLLGYKTKIGALILFFFLMSTTILVWLGSEHPSAVPIMMRDLSLAGAALFISYFGPGPMSLDKRLAVDQE
jgi:uncharacterized membrane protein YphA (DoxX/SURF4 family)